VTSRDFADDPNSEEDMFQPFLQKPDSATATHRIIAAPRLGLGAGAGAGVEVDVANRHRVLGSTLGFQA